MPVGSAWIPTRAQADVLRAAPPVDEIDDDDTLLVNCGRCGKRLIVRLRDILDKHTIDCSQCENALLCLEEATSRPGAVDEIGGRRH
jgi:hypothetical protein